jgi:hypothetical protein
MVTKFLAFYGTNPKVQSCANYSPILNHMQSVHTFPFYFLNTLLTGDADFTTQDKHCLFMSKNSDPFSHSLFCRLKMAARSRQEFVCRTDFGRDVHRYIIWWSKWWVSESSDGGHDDVDNESYSIFEPGIAIKIKKTVHHLSSNSECRNAKKQDSIRQRKIHEATRQEEAIIPILIFCRKFRGETNPYWLHKCFWRTSWRHMQNMCLRKLLVVPKESENSVRKWRTHKKRGEMH